MACFVGFKTNPTIKSIVCDDEIIRHEDIQGYRNYHQPKKNNNA